MATKRNSWRLGNGLCQLCLVLMPLAFAGAVKADPGLTVLPPYVLPVAINGSGKVTGTDGSNHGFLRMPDGSMIIFNAGNPDTQNYTWAQCINDKGVIAGGYRDRDSFSSHGFVRNADGTFATFDAPGANEDGPAATGINAKGVVTGYYADDAYMTHGFVRAADNTVTAIDVPGAYQTFATGINDKGVIAGYAVDGNTGITRGFIRSAAGAFTIFEAQGGARLTVASAIDDNGTVTGGYSVGPYMIRSAAISAGRTASSRHSTPLQNGQPSHPRSVPRAPSQGRASARSSARTVLSGSGTAT